MKQPVRPTQGVAKFAESQQVLYRAKSGLITSYLGGGKTVICESWYLDAYNYSAAELYLLAIKKISGKKSLTSKHICFEVEKDLRHKLFLTNAKAKDIGEAATNDWYKQNAYCVQITDDGDEQTKYALMFTHLNKYFHEAFGIIGGFEIRETPCFVLTRLSNGLKPQSGKPLDRPDDQIGVSNGKVFEFVYAFNSCAQNLLELPVVDETDFAGTITINITREVSSVNATNKELEEYNLKLIEGIRRIAVIVIKLA